MTATVDSPQRTVPVLLRRSLVVLAILGAVIGAVLFTVSLADLASGPSNSGYGLLDVAVHVAIAESFVVGAACTVAAISGQGPVLVHGFVLLLTSGFTAGIALGLFAMGSVLASIDPEGQPADLNSMIFALWGVGSQLWPIPVILVASACFVWLSPILPGLVARRGPTTTGRTAG